MTVDRARLVAVAVALAAAACQQPTPLPPRPAAAPAAPVPATAAVAPVPAQPARPAAPDRVALPSRDFLPGPLYFCAVGDARTAIGFEPKVEALCRRHPEMGPCQYERGLCRAKGGRVYTARGEEVTAGVEAEYDKAVMRVRFQADGGAKR